MDKLFEPIQIGKLELSNRWMRSATAESLSDEQGRPWPELTAMYRTLAEGGVGLIVTGHAFIAADGRCHHHMSGIHHDEMIPLWQAVTTAVHAVGGKIAMQINHGGRQCDPSATDGKLLAPSPLPYKPDSPRPHELSERDIRRLIRDFALAAGRVRAAGFDAVQLHGAHGYLIHSFNSPASNRRGDAWGGSLSHRLRFLGQVCAAVRNEVGGDFPVLIKLGTMDFVRDGLSEDDGVEIISHLADMGLDAVEISGGIALSNDRASGNTRPGIRHLDQEAYFLPIARRARQVTDLPIMLVGGLRSAGLMRQILDEGSADLVSLCRPLIRQPDLPNCIRQGDDRATCISCNQCWPRPGERGVSCHYVAAPSLSEQEQNGTN